MLAEEAAAVGRAETGAMATKSSDDDEGSAAAAPAGAAQSRARVNTQSRPRGSPN